MPASRPVGYLITFRCYGTWRHGDSRSSFVRTGPGDAAEEVPENPIRETWELHRLKHQPARLDERARALVEETIREACQYRNWTLHAVQARTEHVHLVAAPDQLQDRQQGRHDLVYGGAADLMPGDLAGGPEPYFVRFRTVLCTRMRLRSST